jgi:hypothetical protein
VKPRFLRRNYSCPDCGLVIEDEHTPKPEGWAEPWLKLPPVPFDCPRCKAHYVADEFFQLNTDKWSHDMAKE